MISTSHFHPMLVHFPIALVTVGFFAELLSMYVKKEVCFSKLGFYLLLAGTISAIFALLSGLIFTDEMSGAAHDVLELHELFAFTTLGLLLVTSIIRTYLVIKKEEHKTLMKIAFILYALALYRLGALVFLEEHWFLIT